MKYTDRISVNAFIIPNSAPKLAQIFEGYQEEEFNTNSAICKLNGMEFNQFHDHLVEMWWTDGESDNMQAHGFTAFGHGYRIPNYIPESFFKGKREGDIVTITLPLENEKGEVDELTFDVKLSQLNYRYRRFGTFEEVLKKVCA